jgi:tetratricopeptide (TPR) repeat protein
MRSERLNVPLPSLSTPRSIGPWLALAAGGVAYANSFGGDFQFDDFSVIVDNPRIQSWSAWLHAAASGGLRPVLNLSYTASYLSGRGTPFAFHLGNLLVHLGTVAFVYALTLAFMRRYDPARDWRAAATWAATLFAVHPVHSEAITYLCGRSSSLMTLFYLAALWCYARHAAGARGYGAASVGLFLLAVLTKEGALLFPLALLAWDKTGATPWRVVLARHAPYWLVGGVATLLLLLHPGYWSLMWDSVHVRNLHESFATQLMSTVALLGTWLWPASLNLDPDWPRVTNLSAAAPQLMAVLAAMLIAWQLRTRRPWISFGVLWLLIHLLLGNTFFPRADIANERQLYWADWGLFLLAGVELQLALPRRTAWAVVACSACVLAMLTHARNVDYASAVALWQDTASKSPGKARVHNNLGYAYQNAGRTDEARRAYQTALALQPGSVKATNNLRRLEEANASR